jgi:hypothetical protein
MTANYKLSRIIFILLVSITSCHRNPTEPTNENQYKSFSYNVNQISSKKFPIEISMTTYNAIYPDSTKNWDLPDENVVVSLNEQFTITLTNFH